jgi:hypothetical protein
MVICSGSFGPFLSHVATMLALEIPDDHIDSIVRFRETANPAFRIMSTCADHNEKRNDDKRDQSS